MIMRISNWRRYAILHQESYEIHAALRVFYLHEVPVMWPDVYNL